MYALNGTIILHVVLYECETWSFTLGEEHTVRFEGGTEQEAGKNIWPKIDEKQEPWENCIMRSFEICTASIGGLDVWHMSCMR